METLTTGRHANFNPIISELLYREFTDMPIFLRPSREQHRQFVSRVFPDISNWASQYKFDPDAFDLTGLVAFERSVAEKVEGIRLQFKRQVMQDGVREGLNPSIGICE